MTKVLNELLEPIRAEYAASADWQRISELAYPLEVKETKTKKAKDKGDPAKREAALAAKTAALTVKEDDEAK